MELDKHCLALQNDTIYNRIRYLISLKSSIIHIFSPYVTKIKVDSYDSLPIEKNRNTH